MARTTPGPGQGRLARRRYETASGGDDWRGVYDRIGRRWVALYCGRGARRKARRKRRELVGAG
jgi:hypothetical protein